jgi:GT2 family glycosyltransferase
VIATRDRAGDLERTLERLVALPGRPPVLVVDNASTDGTRALVRRWAARGPVTLIPLGENRGAAARTVGVEAARTPLVAFNDDDSWWEPDSLVAALAIFARNPTLGLVAARVVLRGAHDDPVAGAMARSPMRVACPLPGPAVVGFVACAAIVRRDAYLAVGGFHPRYGVGGEEDLLALDLWAAGHAVAYVPALVAHHHPSPRREADDRRVRQVRNELWTLWLRRSPGAVAAGTARRLAAGRHDPAARAGVAAAAAGVPWVLRERRAVPPWLEEQVRRVRATEA